MDNKELIKILITIIGFLITAIISLCIFYFRKMDSSISDLKAITEEQKSLIRVKEAQCGGLHKLIDSKLDSIHERLEEHGKRISQLESK